MTESVQKWLERNRPPRVKITYEVHTGGAMERRELPFIVGIFADLSGDGAAALPTFKERQMLPIDRDNFDDVLSSQKPSVKLSTVVRTLPFADGSLPVVAADGTRPTLSGDIVFSQLDDFEPVAVIKAIPDLNRLYRVRGHIRALQSLAEANDPLADALDGLLEISPAAQARRANMLVLGRPVGANDEAIAAAKLEAFRLAATIATSADDTARMAAAAEWGVEVLTKPDPAAPGATLPDPGNTLLGLRRILGLFSVADDPELLGRATDQLTALAGLTAADLPKAPASVEGVVNSLGLTSSNAPPVITLSQKLVDAMGTAIPAPTPQNRAEVSAAKSLLAWAHLAARVLLGLQEQDDEAPMPKPGAEQSERTLSQANQASANRWVATNALLQLRAAIAADATKSTPVAAAENGSDTRAVWDRLHAVEDLLGKALRAGEQLPDDYDRLNLLACFGQFALHVLKPLEAAGPLRVQMRAATAIDQKVHDIDKALSSQLSAVMHCDAFRTIEATWRGLYYFVSRTETGKLLKLRVFNATKEVLLGDLEKAVDRDQSHLFKMIYEAEYGTLGGDPYSLLIGGYEITRSAQDISFLQLISAVAASAHAPFITAASAALFGLQSFGDLARPRDLAKIFESADLAGWQEFRASEDSRYVSLVLPHVLLRLPYGKDSWPVQGLEFEEDVGTNDSDRFLWGNAAYMLAERITHAFSLYSWTAAIRGVEGGGLIEGLPTYTYDTGGGTKALFCPTEVAITDRREKELNDLGFISLCHSKGKGQAAFFGGQTTNLPKKYITPDANANAQLSALLPYMLAASRFAHYIKVIMRDKIGSFLTRGNVEAFLNTWITQYVLLDENAMQEAKASFPLSQANIVVTDVPGEVGTYNAVVFLRPHFQLEELTTSIRLVAKLPT